MLVLTKKMKILWWIWIDDVPTECCIIYIDGSIRKGNSFTNSETQFQTIKPKVSA